MRRPEVIAFCDPDKVRDPLWTPQICACGATITLDGMPERRVGNETHGVLICLRDAPLPPPECCQECGAPFNNANAPEHGLCAACFAGVAEDYDIAEREALDDYEATRGVERG